LDLEIYTDKRTYLTTGLTFILWLFVIQTIQAKNLENGFKQSTLMAIVLLFLNSWMLDNKYDSKTRKKTTFQTI